VGLFRRRRPGRHELGSAVRDIPSAVPTVVVHPPAVPGLVPAPPAPAVPVQQGPRVELGFRDGTTAALAPDSAQARALVALAGVLARRD
jgi:hypothetical protein